MRASTRGAGRPRGGDGVLRADAKVERVGDAWEVVVRTARGDARGERRIEARSCAELAEATALVLALALQGSSREEATATATTAAEAPAATTAAPAAASPAEAPPPPPPPPASSTVEAPRDPERPVAARAKTAEGADGLVRFAVSASGALATSTLPSAAAGGVAEVAWTPGRWRLGVVGGLFAAQSGAVASGTSGARFQLRSLGARACMAVLETPLELGPCAGVALTDVRARGTGMAEPYETGASWASAEGGLRAGLPLGRMAALVASADLVVPLARPTFVVDGNDLVHRPSAMGTRLALGAELHFP